MKLSGQIQGDARRKIFKSVVLISQSKNMP